MQRLLPLILAFAYAASAMSGGWVLCMHPAAAGPVSHAGCEAPCSDTAPVESIPADDAALGNCDDVVIADALPATLRPDSDLALPLTLLHAPATIAFEPPPSAHARVTAARPPPRAAWAITTTILML